MLLLWAFASPVLPMQKQEESGLQIFQGGMITRYWKNCKIGLEKKNIRIKMDSDRACYILGEVWRGNARGCSDAIFLSVGTGMVQVLSAITRSCVALMILPVLSDGWDWTDLSKKSISLADALNIMLQVKALLKWQKNG